MITSASFHHLPTYSASPRAWEVLPRSPATGTICEPSAYAGGIDVMATAAQRAQKKDLGPDWRETLSASIRGFVRKTVGVALVGPVDCARRRARHPLERRSQLHHRRRRTADQLAGQLRRLCQRCAAVPVRAGRGLVPAAGRAGRSQDDARCRHRAHRTSACWSRRLASALIGIALGLYAGISGVRASRRIWRGARPGRGLWRRCRGRAWSAIRRSRGRCAWR